MFITQQFFLSMLDLVLVPLGIVAALIPWRSYHALEAYGLVKSANSHENYNFDLRFTFVQVCSGLYQTVFISVISHVMI
jgi:hypothetical protein